MNRTIAFAGCKQSGKTTLCNFLHGYQLRAVGVAEDFYLNKSGELVVKTNSVDESGKEELSDVYLDINRRDLSFAEWASHSMWPFIKKYSFATPLKEVAIHIFGLKPEQVYGTEEHKKQVVPHLKWENMPAKSEWSNPNKKGLMTVRDFLQYFGTDICRKMDNDIWVKKCLSDIASEESMLAVIDDCRFPNEAEAIQKAGGKVIHLTRDLYKDEHSSETALKTWGKFDAVIDTENLDIHESCKALMDIFNEWDWFENTQTSEKTKTIKETV